MSEARFNAPNPKWILGEENYLSRGCNKPRLGFESGQICPFAFAASVSPLQPPCIMTGGRIFLRSALP